MVDVSKTGEVIVNVSDDVMLALSSDFEKNTATNTIYKSLPRQQQ